jgi:repressor LexA
MTPKLPARQLEVLEFLRGALREQGYVPSIREIASALGLQSTSTIHHHLTGLAERGLIRWEKGKNRAIQLLDEPTVAPGELPILGRIAAGSPIEALGDGRETLDLASLWAQGGNYLLEVKGQSMIEDHITPGDLVVVRPQPNAHDGEIVVALIDGQEATLKRFYREADRIRLQPANSEMEPIYVRPDQLLIQGKIIGVIRQVH